MGMHTKTNEILKSYGFTPSSNKTYALGENSKKIKEAIAILEETLSLEGLVRIYAPLAAAAHAPYPKPSLGTAGGHFRAYLLEAIGRKRGVETPKTIEERLSALEAIGRKRGVETPKTIEERLSALEKALEQLKGGDA